MAYFFAVPNPKQDWFLFHKAVATHRYYIPAFFNEKNQILDGLLMHLLDLLLIILTHFRLLMSQKMYVEITESEKITQAEIRQLKPFSGTLIIDDFGCETTNIGLIRSLKPYGVKLDRVFWESTPEFLSELIKELKRHSTIIIGEKS